MFEILLSIGASDSQINLVLIIQGLADQVLPEYIDKTQLEAYSFSIIPQKCQKILIDIHFWPFILVALDLQDLVVEWIKVKLISVFIFGARTRHANEHQERITNSSLDWLRQLVGLTSTAIQRDV